MVGGEQFHLRYFDRAELARDSGGLIDKGDVML